MISPLLSKVRQLTVCVGAFAFFYAISNKDITKIFSLICHYCAKDAVNNKRKVSKGHQENTYYHRDKYSPTG